jgi:hypothetical protein
LTEGLFGRLCRLGRWTGVCRKPPLTACRSERPAFSISSKKVLAVGIIPALAAREPAQMIGLAHRRGGNGATLAS